ncbi:MAG: hypothetical protein ACODAJ_05055 [Planctomycetota bacterium]
MSTKGVTCGTVALATLVVAAAVAFALPRVLPHVLPGSSGPSDEPSSPPPSAVSSAHVTMSVPADPAAREAAAQRLLDQAKAAADREAWDEVEARLAELVDDYAFTHVYMIHRRAVDRLRALAERDGAPPPRPPSAAPEPEPEPTPRKVKIRRRKAPYVFEGGKLTIEAEEPNRLYPPLETGEDEQAGGDGFIWEPRRPGQEQFSSDKPRAVFYVRCDQDCEVSLYARVRAPSNDQNSLFLAVERGARTKGELAAWHFAPNPQWAWAAFAAGSGADRTAEEPSPVRLRKGLNSIIIAVRERNTALDRIRLIER